MDWISRVMRQGFPSLYEGDRVSNAWIEYEGADGRTYRARTLSGYREVEVLTHDGGPDGCQWEPVKGVTYER